MYLAFKKVSELFTPGWHRILCSRKVSFSSIFLDFSLIGRVVAGFWRYSEFHQLSNEKEIEDIALSSFARSIYIYFLRCKDFDNNINIDTSNVLAVHYVFNVIMPKDVVIVRYVS